MLSQHPMDRTALLVISHMSVQYIKDSTDWVIPQSVRQYHYGFPSRKVLVVLLSCLLGYCLRSTCITRCIDFNTTMISIGVGNEELRGMSGTICEFVVKGSFEVVE